MSSAPTYRYERNQDVVTREILGDTLLVPICSSVADMSNIFALNDTGAFVWKHLDGTTSLARIRDAMARDFDVTEEVAWADLAALMGDLDEAGLVRRVD